MKCKKLRGLRLGLVGVYLYFCSSIGAFVSKPVEKCSSICPEYDPVVSLDLVPSCYSKRFRTTNSNGAMTSVNTAQCLANLACYLKHAPDRIEWLEAMGMFVEGHGTFSGFMCLANSRSSQSIPPPVEVEGVLQAQAYRCVLGWHDGYDTDRFIGGSVWCGVTTTSTRVECESQQEPKGCGTHPMGFDLKDACTLIEKAAEGLTEDDPRLPTSKVTHALFNNLVKEATGNGENSCVRCHTKNDLKPDKPRKEDEAGQCYEFQFAHGGQPVCPLDSVEGLCSHDAKAFCPDGKRPTCEGINAEPKCSNGVPKCPTNPKEEVECGYRLMPVAAEKGNFCEESAKLVDYLSGLTGGGEAQKSLPFVKEFRTRMCPVPSHLSSPAILGEGT